MTCNTIPHSSNGIDLSDIMAKEVKKINAPYMRKQGFIVLITLFSITMTGQTEMLIGQISGRVVIRENFDKEGDFLNKQTFEAGETIKENGYYEIKVVTELFDKNKQSTDKYTTTYRCEPDDANVMIMAFPFSKPKSKETEINTISENFKKLYDLQNLKDIKLEMSFDSGLLNFFWFQKHHKNLRSKIRSWQKHY